MLHASGDTRSLSSVAVASSLVSSGLHHVLATGNVTAGSAVGEAAAAVANSLVRIALPFSKPVYVPPGFEDQVFVVSKSNDGNSTDIRLDATPIEYDLNTGAPILRIRIDLLAFPAAVTLWIEANHSTGR